MHRSPSVRRSILLVSLLAAFAVACASSSTSSVSVGSSPSPTGAYPLTVDAANGKVTLAAMPTRIVSLSPTATEMLFAIGAGAQVVAADSYSNYPSDAPTTKLSAYEPNAEAIANYQPDLVIYATDPGDLQSSLDKLKITALSEPAAATLDDVYAQMEQLGQATGHADEAAAQVSDLKSKIQAVGDQVGDAGKGMTYYYELDDTYYSVTSDTFIGAVLAELGLKNIADQAKGASSGYPQLSAEYIVQADPDLVLLADTKCCGQDAEKVAKRPGWSDLTAVHNGGVVELDDDVASRWGPRIADLLQQVGDAVQTQAQAGG
ncbi:MAG TPA: ABC transporter substrate-binding protein [Actinomycetota bacterium]|nr:ABC transporter substrate-binding protein [Actinomycetota bacterium]